MEIELDDEEIRKGRANIDRLVLITALEVFANHRFLKARISEIKIEEVYDSAGNVKPEILIRSSGGPAKTTDGLRSILSSYLDHLKEGNLAEPHMFLFPGYGGENGQKQLQRHIKHYTKYRDFNGLKKEARKDIDRRLADAGISPDERVNQIAAATGLTHRAAEQSVRPHSSAGESKPRKEKDEKTTGLHKFIKKYDEIVVIPEIDMLDESEVGRFIDEALSLLTEPEAGTRISPRGLDLIKYGFIRDLQCRVLEIQDALVEEGKAVEGSEVALDEPVSYLELLRASIRENGTMLAADLENNMIVDQSLPVPEPEEILQPLAQRNNSLKTPEDAEPQVTAATIDANIDQLITHIRRVQKLVPKNRWQAWIVHKASKEKIIPKRSAKELKSKGKNKEPSVTIPRDTEASIKRKRIGYFKEWIQQNAQDNLIIVLENARELIKYTGLYSHEVPRLRIQDVVRSEHNKLLLEPDAQRDWIVDEIQPVSGKYPRGCSKLPIQLSDEAKEIIAKQIEFLKGTGPQYGGNLFTEQELFPLHFLTQRVKGENEAELRRRGKKPKPPRTIKISPEESKRRLFVSLLQSANVLGGRFDHHLEYEHLREYGIRLYCSKLRDEERTFEKVIEGVRGFARYRSDADAKRICEKTIKYAPDQYESIYKIAINLGDRLKASLNKSSVRDIIDIERFKFIAAVDLLSDNHKSAFHREYKDVLNYST